MAKKGKKEGAVEEKTEINQPAELSLLSQLLSFEYQYCLENCSEDDANELKHKYLELFPASAKELFG